MRTPSKASPRCLPGLSGLRRLASLFWLGLALCPAVTFSAAPAFVRFGFSRAMFLDLNENDARAAVKVYASVMGSANDLLVSESPMIFNDPAKIAEALARGTADVVAMPVLEYLTIPHDLTSPRLLAADVDGAIGEEYILLVRDDSGIATLADLRGRRLIVNNSLRTSLASLWLDALLAKAGLDPPTLLFSHVGSANKPTRTVLPVFFHQEDACIVTRRGYTVMGELNPQVMRQMRVLATSPSYVPVVVSVRASVSRGLLERIIKATIAAQHSVSGEQMFNIFQCQGITEITSERLDNVRELLAEHARLRARTNTAAIKRGQAR